MSRAIIIITALLCSLASAQLLILPPAVIDKPQSHKDHHHGWSPKRSCQTIYLDSTFAPHRDADGLTLIPPTAHDFAQTFQDDLAQITGVNWTLTIVDSLPEIDKANGAILLGNYTGDRADMIYQDGTPTSEGYSLDISPHGISISGTGSRGMWWGTRTFLQMLLTTDSGVLPAGRTLDAPAYSTRGYMFDAGRKWYKPSFLKEMCSYASFFKMSEFHYHLSDNYPLNRGKNDTWQDVYSHFSLLPEDESLRGIVHGRENETLSRDEFADVQSHCARRGPELSLDKRDLLNLSHPETIPTVKRIWAEFLPWFETKEVHVGADEYDAALADDYIGFVNEMSDFLRKTGDKRTRIWGTYMDPPVHNVSITTDVTIQHWQYTQTDPVDLVDKGYHVLNSHDWWAYMSIKNDHTPILPATYPQFFNESRILNFADKPGWQWTPADFNNVNASMQLNDTEPLNGGAIMAAWNDNGPDASTQLEMYYAMRRGIPLVGARAWTGTRGPQVDADTISPTIDFFSTLAPAQNLDRSTGPISWKRSPHHAKTVKLGHGSKGMNYTLNIKADGPFTLSSSDVTLSLDAEGRLVFNSDGYEYPLRSVTPSEALVLDPGNPGRIWDNTTSTHEEVHVKTPVDLTIATDVQHGSVVWVDGNLAGRYEVFVYGGRNTLFSWSQMAFVAPLEQVDGDLTELEVKDEARRLEKWSG
ncbi:hexosaminidase [Geosmithia morbida]|uniref:beta-N-acetylhexosaminidase n=1 Tax=Geosmithia morbida TaxID=1094350 RepID=A0A9P4Z136_9HYPO|nr:hexosaminidase [Geosmithia morbida]KAF4125482.1 hexosaminidase [Geosmithia morbida]